jgi:ribosomal protein L40E
MQAQCPHCESIFTVPGTPAPLDPAAPITVLEAGADEGAAVGLEGRICPGCKADLPREAVICIHCGFDLRTGKKLASEKSRRRPKRRLQRLWDGDMAMTTRIVITAVVLGILLLSAVLIAIEADAIGALVVFVLFAPMVVLGLGTFTRTELTTNTREEPVIRLTRRCCFIVYEQKTHNPRKFDRISLEHQGEGTGSMVLVFLLLFCLCGVVPALVYVFAFSGRFQVALLAEGAEPVVVYRGWSEALMREIGDAIAEGTGLGYS